MTWTADSSRLATNEKIAKIDTTFLGIEDHGIMTCWLHCSYGDSGQGVGGYSLDAPPLDNDDGNRFGPRQPNAECGRWVAGVLRCCNVDSWEKVAGRSIIVIFESDEYGAMPCGIRPLPTEKGTPFIFREEQ